jgi:hypothetical protein
MLNVAHTPLELAFHKCAAHLNAAPFVVVGIEWRSIMNDTARIREHMEVIGADGVHVGTVDGVEGERIKLTKKDSGEGRHEGYHHYIPLSLVAEVEGDRVRLSANSDVAVMFEEEKSDPV